MPAPPKRPTSTPPRRATRDAPPAIDMDDGPAATSRAMDSATEDDGEHTVPGSSDATVNMTADEAEAAASSEGANATVVFDTNKGMRKGAAAAPTAKLIVNKGPKQGAEFTLGPGETSIGRNNDNTIVIPDISVSRKHVVLVKQGTGYLLQDQGSGNGTLLNGTPVGEQLLKDGDSFSIGDTEIQFVTVGGATAAPPRRGASSVSNAAAAPAAPAARRPGRAAPAPRAAPRAVGSDEDEAPEHTGQINYAGGEAKKGKSKALIPLVAVMGVLMLLGLGWKWKQNKLVADQRREEEAGNEKRQRDAVDVFRIGKDLAQKGDWTQALAKFTEAKVVGLQDPELEDYISRAQKEISNQKLLQDAQTALDAHNLASAMDAVGKIPGDSLLSDKADDFKKKIKDAIPERITAARSLIATKDWTGTQKILDDVEKVDPNNTGLHDAQDELSKAQNKPVAVHVGHTVVATDPTQDVRAAFKNGDLKTAKELAAQFGQTNDKIKQLGQEIADFEVASAASDSDPAAADKAAKLDALICGGGHSVFTNKFLKQRLSKNLKEGLEAKSGGNLTKAYKLLSDAHNADPSNAECTAALNEIKSKAHEIYMDGYTEKGDNPEGAKAKFTQVINMTPADDENHIKAKARLQEMGN